MAATKVKKPVSKKLKAGQKKKGNKWLILGGVAAVAIIGAVVVRFSSASTWVPIWQSTSGLGYIDYYDQAVYSSAAPPRQRVTITKGHTYRFCVSGRRVSNNNSSVQLGFLMYDLNGKEIGVRAVSTKAYGKPYQKHCSANFNASKASYSVVGRIRVNNNYLSAEKLSIEYLR